MPGIPAGHSLRVLERRLLAVPSRIEPIHTNRELVSILFGLYLKTVRFDPKNLYSLRIRGRVIPVRFECTERRGCSPTLRVAVLAGPHLLRVVALPLLYMKFEERAWENIQPAPIEVFTFRRVPYANCSFSSPTWIQMGNRIFLL